MNIVQNSIRAAFFEALEKGIIKGQVELITPDGHHHIFGEPEAEKKAVWRLHSWAVVDAIAKRGDIGLGESYVAQLWEADDLEALLHILISNFETIRSFGEGSKLRQFLFYLYNSFVKRNSVAGSAQNIQAHYDVGNDFYKLWLDKTMTYSSAIYTSPEMSLEQAQYQKYGRILDKITPSRKNVLEIGCGWGGFAEQAIAAGHTPTGLTISPAQHAIASQRIGNQGEIRLQDYRHTTGTFDSIVSIEMFEAVGKAYWPSYFSTLKNRLATDGVAMVQTITIADDMFDFYARRSDYIRHYVFPGGMLPSVAQFKDVAERANLVCRDVYCFGQDYARTLREWLQRFDHFAPDIRAMGYDEGFMRSWRLYLSMCAASFATGQTNVAQIEVAHA